MAEYGVKQIFHTALTANDATDKEGVGTERIENGIRYVYVQDSGSGVTAKTLCYFNVGTADITTVPASKTNPFALYGALAVPQATLTASYFGWVAVNGVVDVLKMQTKFAAGDAMCVGATLGKLQKCSTTQTRMDALYVLAAASTTEADVSCRIAFM